MRPLVFALAATLSAGVPPVASDKRPEVQAARPLHVVYERATLEGMCTLVDVEEHTAGLTLYFITSARLFKDAQGEPFMTAREVRVVMDDGTEVSVPREYRYLPIGNFSDIAVLRADVAASGLVPASMRFSIPLPGRAFDIVGLDRDGLPRIQTQEVRFTSTRFIVGDRDPSMFAACLGAPVIDGDEVVGVVSECEPGRAPLMTPLSVAFPFLVRHIPVLTGRSTSTEQP
jgi:hypothetical protein